MKGILALDQGTTSSKAAVFDLRGRLLGYARVPVATRFGDAGRVEQDALALVATQRLAARRAVAAAGHPELVAAGVSSQRSTFVIWDRVTGRPIAPAPTWQDTRAVARCDRLARHAARVRRITGLPLSPHYSASKIGAVLDGIPGARGRARRAELLCGSVATFLLWTLSGGRTHVIDPTLAARTLLFDIERLDWDRSLLDLFGVPGAMMPQVRHSLDDHGEIRIGGRAVAVRACLGDQQAALLGVTAAGGAGSGEAVVNYGTGAFVLVPTGRAPVRRDGLLTSLAFTAPGRRRYLVEGTINGAGVALDWLRRELGAPVRFGALDRICRRAVGDAMALAPSRGLGSAWLARRDRDLPGIAVGLGERGSVAEIARGVVESIAHQVDDLLRRAERAGTKTGGLVLSGSLTGLPYLVEYQAALAGRRVRVARRREATLAGAAIAACGAGAASWSPDRGSPVRPSREVARRAAGGRARWRRLLDLARRWGRGGR